MSATNFTLPGDCSIRLPSMQAIVTYLCITGLVTTFALVFALLLFLGYLAQLLLQSIMEIAHLFNELDPIVRLLILALVVVLVLWRMSHHWRAQGYGKH